MENNRLFHFLVENNAFFSLTHVDRIHDPEYVVESLNRHNGSDKKLIELFRFLVGQCLQEIDVTLEPWLNKTITCLSTKQLNGSMHADFEALKRLYLGLFPSKENLLYLLRTAQFTRAMDLIDSKVSLEEMTQFFNQQLRDPLVRRDCYTFVAQAMERSCAMRSKIFTAFLNSGVSINSIFQRKNTLLTYALEHCEHPQELIEILFRYHPNVNQEDGYGNTAVQLAVIKNYGSIVQFLISQGARCDIPDPETGNTILHIAALKGYAEIVRLLIESNVDCNVRAEDGGVPLHFAAANGHREVADLLIKNSDINKQDNASDMPLHLAMKNQHLAVATLLIANGAEHSQEDKDWLLQLSIKKNEPDAVTFCVLIGASVTALNEGGNTHLHAAVLQKNVRIVRLLIEAGIAVNTRNTVGETALHWASFFGYEEIVTALIANGADYNARTTEEATPLHFALVNEHVAVAKILINHQCSLHSIDIYGKNVLSVCLINGMAEMALFLFSQGVVRQEQVIKEIEKLKYRKESLQKLFGDVPELAQYLAAIPQEATFLDIANYIKQDPVTCLRSIALRGANPLEFLVVKGFSQTIIRELVNGFPRKELRVWIDDLFEKYPKNIESLLNIFFTINERYWNLRKTGDVCLLPPDPDVSIERYKDMLHKLPLDEPLVVQGITLTPEMFKQAVTLFITRVENSTPFLLTPPAGSFLLQQFYDYIRNVLKHVLVAIAQEIDLEKRHKKMLNVFEELAAASGYCGPRYHATARLLYYRHVLHKEVDFEELLNTRIDELRDVAIDAMLVLPCVNSAQSIHAASYFRYKMSELLGWEDPPSLFAKRDLCYRDGFKDRVLPSDALITDEFFKFFSISNIFLAIQDMMQNSDIKSAYLSWAQKQMAHFCPTYQKMKEIHNEIKKIENKLVGLLLKRTQSKNIQEECNRKVEQLREQLNKNGIEYISGYSASEAIKDEQRGSINKWLCDEHGAVRYAIFIKALEMAHMINLNSAL